MGIIFEAIINWFVGGKMDDVHKRSPTVFWVILLAMLGLTVLVIALAGE